MPDSLGSTAQNRVMLEQVAEAVYAKYAAEHPRAQELPEARVPTPLKWAAVIVAGLMTVGSAGLLFWMISSISAMQLTLARMDERQSMNASNWEAKFRSLDERMARLEKQQEVR